LLDLQWHKAGISNLEPDKKEFCCYIVDEWHKEDGAFGKFLLARFYLSAVAMEVTF
jgi:hypothetical protein